MPSSGNVGGFQAPQLAPPPDPNVKVETYADKAEQQQAQMPPVYYGGKAGSVAFMADKVLTGWLAGTKMGHERRAKQMADEVGAAKTGLDYIGQAYRAAVEAGDPKKIDETKRALSEAYNDYLNKAEKYAMPDQQMGMDGKPKKPGIGSKIKQGLMGGENPHLAIAHSTLEIMRKSDPTQLYGPSKQEQRESKLLDLQTSRMEKDQANQDRWEKLQTTEPQKWTPEDKKFNAFYEYERFGKTKEQQTKDQLLSKITEGQQLSPQEKQLGEQFGLIKPDQTSVQMRTTTDKKGNPVSEIVPITTAPDGKVTVGAPVKLPGNDYVPPNQAQMAGQMINAQMSALTKWGAKMHPEWDPKTPEGQKALTQWAMTTLYPPTAGTINWADQNQKMDTMNRAINAVLQKHHPSKRKDPNDPNKEIEIPDDMSNAILGNVVTTTDDGRYAYMPTLAPGATEKVSTSTWYKPWSWGDTQDVTKWSGLTREQLNDQERKFQAELRAELKKQNPKMPDSYLDQLVPMAVSRQQGQAMQPPPSAQSQQSAGGLQAPPAEQGQAWYTVTLPDGTRTKRQMSQEYADALQSRGVKVESAGQ